MLGKVAEQTIAQQCNGDEFDSWRNWANGKNAEQCGTQQIKEMIKNADQNCLAKSS